MFKRRIGDDPHSNGTMTTAASGCPDIWELDDGSFAVIGLHRSEELRSVLPPSASCGPDESIVVIPRDLLTRAKIHIPDN